MMTQYMQHPSEEVQHKIIELCNALCMWEQNTGRSSVLLILEDPEYRFWANSGKPVPTKDIGNAARIKAHAMKQIMMGGL